MAEVLACCILPFESGPYLGYACLISDLTRNTIDGPLEQLHCLVCPGVKQCF